MDGLEVSDDLRAAMLSVGPAGGGSEGGPAVVVANAQGMMQITNQAAHDLFGYTKVGSRLVAGSIWFLCCRRPRL